jgi:hypothetical protein
LLLHAAQFLKEALTGATDDGGGWAWVGLLAGGVAGYLLAFSGDGPWTAEIVALGLVVVGACAVAGAYLGCLGKLAFDYLTEKRSPPDSS